MKTLLSYLADEGIKHSEFAKDLGISKAHMSGIVNRTKSPSLDLALRIRKMSKGQVDLETLAQAPQSGAA